MSTRTTKPHPTREGREDEVSDKLLKAVLHVQGLYGLSDEDLAEQLDVLTQWFGGRFGPHREKSGRTNHPSRRGR